MINLILEPSQGFNITVQIFFFDFMLEPCLMLKNVIFKWDTQIYDSIGQFSPLKTHAEIASK